MTGREEGEAVESKAAEEGEPTRGMHIFCYRYFYPCTIIMQGLLVYVLTVAYSICENCYLFHFIFGFNYDHGCARYAQ